MNEALRPSFISEIPVLVNHDDSEKVTPEELSLYKLGKTKGWSVFKDIAMRTSKELDEKNKQAIMNGLSVEEIGRNAIVINLAQGIIEKLLNKVTDATEACERAEQER